MDARPRSIAATLAGVALLSACPNGADDTAGTAATADARPLMASFPEQVLRVKSHLESDACNPTQLTEVAKEPKFYVAKKYVALERLQMKLIGCSDRDQCETARAAIRREETPNTGMFLLLSAGNADVITGGESMSGEVSGGVCKAAQLRLLEIRKEANGDYRIEERVIEGDVPAKGESCDLVAVERELRSRPCKKLNVTLLEPAPAL